MYSYIGTAVVVAGAAAVFAAVFRCYLVHITSTHDHNVLRLQ